MTISSDYSKQNSIVPTTVHTEVITYSSEFIDSKMKQIMGVISCCYKIEFGVELNSTNQVKNVINRMLCLGHFDCKGDDEDFTNDFLKFIKFMHIQFEQDYVNERSEIPDLVDADSINENEPVLLIPIKNYALKQMFFDLKSEDIGYIPKTEDLHIIEYEVTVPRRCCICLDEMKTTKNTLRLNGCNHIFHTNCILKLAKMIHICPLCKFYGRNMGIYFIEKIGNSIKISEKSFESYRNRLKNILNAMRDSDIFYVRI